jgi:hypothetical protein
MTTYNELYERLEKVLAKLKEMEQSNPSLPDEILDKMECRLEDIGEIMDKLDATEEKQ